MSDQLNTGSDRENANILQPKLNLEPLLIPEIVSAIMKFIQPKDLSKYRLVCTAWNEEIIRQIKDRFTFYFDSVPKMDDFMKNGQIFFGFKNLKLKCVPLGDSEKRILSSHGKLLRRIHFDHGSVKEISTIESYTVVLGIEFMYDILSNSQELEYLKFTQLRFGMLKPEEYQLKKSLSLNTTPSIILYKLTTLDIDLNPYKCHRTQATEQELSIQTQEFYNQFFRMAPNTKELHLTSSDSEVRRSTSTDAISSCIRGLMDVNPLKLDRLYFHSIIPLELATQLSTRLTSNIHKLVFDDLDSQFILNFDTTSLTDNKIEITATKELYSEIPAPDVINYVQDKLSECVTGVSCTRLLQTFLSGFQERTQAGA